MSLYDWPGFEVTHTITGQLGANFSQFMVKALADGIAAQPIESVQTLFYVINGAAELQLDKKYDITTGGFAYIPADSNAELKIKKDSLVLFFEKEFVKDDAPPAFVGNESEIERQPFLGDENALLQSLFPDETLHDMGVNIFTYKPGATLPQVESHWMEHGLYMLEGHGVYRLDDSWYPVKEGDTIWMGPFCLQWYISGGPGLSRYIYYKEMNTDPMHAP